MRGTLRGTGTAEMLESIKRATSYTSDAIDGDCANFLRAAVTELALDADQRERIMRVARTIANLDHSENIRPHHLSEAINYRMFRPYGYH
jgi:predicted ATPase with chaperone activity